MKKGFAVLVLLLSFGVSSTLQAQTKAQTKAQILSQTKLTLKAISKVQKKLKRESKMHTQNSMNTLTFTDVSSESNAEDYFKTASTLVSNYQKAFSSKDTNKQNAAATALNSFEQTHPTGPAGNSTGSSITQCLSTYTTAISQCGSGIGGTLCTAWNVVKLIYCIATALGAS